VRKTSARRILPGNQHVGFILTPFLILLRPVRHRTHHLGVPYFFEPQGKWRRLYNFALSLSTSNFQSVDTLSHWLKVHERLHAGTLTMTPARPGRLVPNAELTLLHAWTLVTAVVSFAAVYA